MPRKRRKPSFTTESLLEIEDKNKDDMKLLPICNRSKKRRSSMATLGLADTDSDILKSFVKDSTPSAANNGDEKKDEASKKQAAGIASKQDSNDYSSDEDMFANFSMYKSMRNDLPSSPVLKTCVKSSTQQKSLMNISTVSECGDDTLIARCVLSPSKTISENCRDVAHVESELEKPMTVTKDWKKSKHKHFNDSVFSDIDLSYVEKNLQVSSNTVRQPFDNCKQENNHPIKSPLFLRISSESDKNVKISCQTSEVKNPKPIAASTSSSDRRKSFSEKLAERFRANAMHETASNVRLQDVAKIFPELLVDFSQNSLQNDVGNKGPFYGLPMRVKELMLSTRGIKTFYEWQDQCLSLPSVVNGKNLIYTLPTSGGKTLVAEMLIMKELICKEKDAMLVLPFVAIVQEKVRGIAQFADELDFLVEEYAGSKGKIPPTKRRKRKSLFICTIEKANTLVNSLIEAERLDTLGLVVIDELHMLGEGGRRGSTIEMMLAKIMHVSSTTQIIGMTATLSNIHDLAMFLQADVYKNNFRPVVLDEFVKCEESLYRVDSKMSNPEEGLSFERVVDFSNKQMATKDTDHIVTLLLEIIPDHSCLVFCPTKKNCENVATMICKLLPSSMKELKSKEKHAILDTLYQDSGGEGVCPVLMRTIPYGVAYHHSGLTSDERSLIETAYNNGVLCVLTCTSTLAAGVNLPARRVIIRSPYIGRGFLSRSQYKQMIGRAGRAGIDTKGESILILTKKQDRQKVMDLVTGPIETCVSSLMYDGGKGFKTLILNLIHLKIMTKMSDVKDFFKRTLISVQFTSMPDRFSYVNINDTALDGNTIVETVTKQSLQELLELKLIRLRNVTEDNNSSDDSVNVSDCFLEITKLGAATNHGSIDFSISNIVYDDLVVGLKSLVLTNYLHLLYLVTPLDGLSAITLDWMIYFEEFGRLSPDEQNAATVIGVPEQYLAMRAAGNRGRSKKYKEEVFKRFYVTLMLYHLFRGKSVWHVASRFNQPRGYLQSLLSSSAAFASCVLHFTKGLEEFWPYHTLLERLIQTLQYCTSLELLPLMEIPGVKLARAKQLYNAGYKTLAQIAKAEVGKLIKCIDHLSRKQAMQITASAKVMLKERIEELQAEAEALQNVPGLPGKPT